MQVKGNFISTDVNYIFLTETHHRRIADEFLGVDTPEEALAKLRYRNAQKYLGVDLATAGKAIHSFKRSNYLIERVCEQGTAELSSEDFDLLKQTYEYVDLTKRSLQEALFGLIVSTDESLVRDGDLAIRDIDAICKAGDCVSIPMICESADFSRLLPKDRRTTRSILCGMLGIDETSDEAKKAKRYHVDDSVYDSLPSVVALPEGSVLSKSGAYQGGPLCEGVSALHETKIKAFSFSIVTPPNSSSLAGNWVNAELEGLLGGIPFWRHPISFMQSTRDEDREVVMSVGAIVFDDLLGSYLIGSASVGEEHWDSYIAPIRRILLDSLRCTSLDNLERGPEAAKKWRDIALALCGPELRSGEARFSIKLHIKGSASERFRRIASLRAATSQPELPVPNLWPCDDGSYIYEDKGILASNMFSRFLRENAEDILGLESIPIDDDEREDFQPGSDLTRMLYVSAEKTLEGYGR